MTRYTLSDGGSTETIEAATMPEARRQARAWAREGEWGDPESTIWIRVRITSDDDPEEQDSITVTIHPTPPDCADDEHDWQAPYELVGGLPENPGVFGHGGGVRITSACMLCGAQRTTDTWATDPVTGEQGLESVTYREHVYDVSAQVTS